jgi:hypothetical protein
LSFFITQNLKVLSYLHFPPLFPLSLSECLKFLSHCHIFAATSNSSTHSFHIKPIIITPLSLKKMSINHFSSDLPEALWWTQLQQKQQHPIMEPIPNLPSSSSARPDVSWTPQLYYQHQAWLNSHNFQEPDDQTPENPTRNQEQEEHQQEEDEEEEEEADETEKEPMFEKPLTPSDVGKLNRLVIPKQHAEKYFPLGGDSGLLLNFEDESGKCWRFRYSYWNSSQSYVLTKGWSRYVKEKRLDAGDVVLFERHRTDAERLFIGWRRRGVVAHDSGAGGHGLVPPHSSSNSGPGWTRVFYSAHPYPTHHPLPYQPDCLHAGAMSFKLYSNPISCSLSISPTK